MLVQRLFSFLSLPIPSPPPHRDHLFIALQRELTPMPVPVRDSQLSNRYISSPCLMLFQLFFPSFCSRSFPSSPLIVNFFNYFFFLLCVAAADALRCFFFLLERHSHNREWNFRFFSFFISLFFFSGFQLHIVFISLLFWFDSVVLLDGLRWSSLRARPRKSIHFALESQFIVFSATHPSSIVDRRFDPSTCSLAIAAAGLKIIERRRFHSHPVQYSPRRLCSYVVFIKNHFYAILRLEMSRAIRTTEKKSSVSL